MEMERKKDGVKNCFTISPRQAIYWKQHSGRKKNNVKKKEDEKFFAMSVLRRDVK